MKFLQRNPLWLRVGIALFVAVQSAVAIKIVVPDQYKDQVESIKTAELKERRDELEGIAQGTVGGVNIAGQELAAEKPKVEADEFLVQSVVEATATASAFEGTLAADEGLVSGQIVDKETGEALAGVAIIIEGTDVATVTAEDGRYSLGPTTAGSFTISFIKSGYIEANVTDYNIAGGEVSVFPFAMPPRPTEMSDEVYELQDFTVTAEEANQMMLKLDLRQSSIATLDILNSEDFAKFGASDAAEAISKMSGASLSDGKYVVMRGLNDRYNTTLINGVRLPSPDPDRKAVALDIFPTSLFEGIVARKTYTSDMPGESSGGSIELITKAIPEEPFVKFSIGAGGQINSPETEDFLADPEQVSLRGWLNDEDRRGFDIEPGTKNLINGYPNEVGGVDFPLTAPLRRKLPGFGDRSYSFSAGGSKELNDWLTVGTVFGLKVSEKRRSSFKETFKIGFGNGQPVVDEVAGSGLVDLGVLTPTEASLNGKPFGGILKSEEEYSASILFGLGAQISDHTSLNYSFLRSESLSSSAERIDYYQYKESPPTIPSTSLSLPANSWYKYTDFEIGSEERLLEAHQFSGEHIFAPFNGGDWTFSWYYTAADMEQQEPDQRIVGEYLPEYGAFASDPGLPPVTRFQRETEQASTMTGFNIDKEWELTDSIKFGFEFGYDSENSEREFRQLESRISQELEVNDPLYAAMPFPNSQRLNDVVGGGNELYYDGFVDDSLSGGVNELVEALYDNYVMGVQSSLVPLQATVNNRQADVNAAQSSLNAAQANLNASVTAWESFTAVDYETQFDPGIAQHVIFNDALTIPALQTQVGDEQVDLNDALADFNTAQTAVNDASSNLTDIQSEQAAYLAEAAALINQIASMPALATDPTAFPTFSFFGNQDYILNTPRGFSVYAEPAPTSSNIQFNSANGLFQARGKSETESFYVSGNLVFDKIPVVNSFRVAGGFREESTLLTYELRENALGEPEPVSGDGAGVSPFVVESSEIDQTDRLSYLALIFEITDNIKLHLSRSNTVAKPTFREIAPFPIFNLSDRSFEQGNGGRTLRTANSLNDWKNRTGDFAGKDDSELPEKFVLPVEFAGLDIAEVESRDIRLEYYTPLDGLISIGYFQKDVGAPIERIFAYASSGVDVNTFINNDNDAELDGIEFELQQNLGIFNELFDWDLKLLDSITLGGNYTKINAEVERSSIEKQNMTNARVAGGFSVPDVFQDGGAESTRPLYDQPAYVANAFITFDIEKTGTRVTLSQNWLGEQLDRAGGISRDGFIGIADTYWDEFSSMNLVVEQRLTDHIKLKFAVKNLDSPVRRLYEDEIFYDALNDDTLVNRPGGGSVAGSAGGFDRSSQTIEPTYSISISGSF